MIATILPFRNKTSGDRAVTALSEVPGLLSSRYPIVSPQFTAGEDYSYGFLADEFCPDLPPAA